MQLAFSFGELHQAAAGEALGRILTKDYGDARLRTAVLSSSAAYTPIMLATVLKMPTGMPGWQQMVDDVVATSASMGDAAS
jgi:hypothetical protein